MGEKNNHLHQLFVVVFFKKGKAERLLLKLEIVSSEIACR